MFEHIYEKIKDEETLDVIWVKALVECYNGESMRNDHVIEGIVKNSLNYLV